jgi:hypothetical protein
MLHSVTSTSTSRTKSTPKFRARFTQVPISYVCSALLTVFAGMGLVSAANAQSIVQSGASTSKSELKKSQPKKPVQPLVNFPESKQIFTQTLADGTILLTDRAEPSAVKTSEVRYRSTAGSDAMRVAATQKDYWKGQSDGFARRQAQKQAEQDSARREQRQLAIFANSGYSDSGWSGPRVLYGAPVPVVSGHFPAQGQSGVGAAHNVPSSFIGSGFATASPFHNSAGTSGSRR